MTLKTKMSLLLFLTSISIVSIGFSSWSITAETTAELNGNIQVDNVINNKNMIKETTSSYFTYCEVGFTDSNNLITKNGTIVVDYNINLTNCKEYLTKNSLSADIALKYLTDSNNTNNIFEDYSNTTTGEYNSLIVSYKISGDLEWTIITPEVTDYQCRLIINFDNALASKETEINFSIMYSFEVTSGRHFYDNYYSVLNSSNFQFLLSTMVTDYQV